MAKKTNGVGTAVAVGAGAVALSAVAYLMFGPEGKKHRKDMKSWMIKMKGDMMEKLEEAQELTQPVYENALAAIEAKYKSMGNIDASALANEVALLKKNWKMVVKQAKAKKKPAAKKTVKAAPKKKVVTKKKK